MAGLPPELQDIVWQYIQAFHVVLSLPKKSAIRRLVRKSNQHILRRFIDVQISLDNGTLLLNPSLFRSYILNNPVQLSILTDCVIHSVRFYPSTGALKWVFLDQDLYLRPDYFELLRKSVLFDVMTHVDFSLI